MHIKNVSKEMTCEGVVAFSFAGIIYLILLHGNYLLHYYKNFSIENYIIYFTKMFKDALNSDLLVFLIQFVIMPVAILIGIIAPLVTRKQAINKLKSKLSLKSIDFLEGMVNFNFYQKESNFSCAYSDIEDFKMIIDSRINKKQNRPSTIQKQTYLKFKLSDGKTYTITTTRTSYKFIYKIIDYSRHMKSFSYELCGIWRNRILEEKINAYIKNGTSEILTNTEESRAIYKSIILFIIGIILLFCSSDNIKASMIKEDWWILLLFFVPLIISFGIDIWLIIDKIKESIMWRK